jgi:hypothetical protein
VKGDVKLQNKIIRMNDRQLTEYCRRLGFKPGLYKFGGRA